MRLLQRRPASDLVAREVQEARPVGLPGLGRDVGLGVLEVLGEAEPRWNLRFRPEWTGWCRVSF